MIKSSFKSKSSKNKKLTSNNKKSKKYIKIFGKSKVLKSYKSHFGKNKIDIKSISSSNIILSHLEKLFYILYKSSGNIAQILKKLNLSKDYEHHLKVFLEYIQRFNILKTSPMSYKFNKKYLKDTNIPKIFLLQVAKENSLKEKLAVFPIYINNANKYNIILDKNYNILQENDYFLGKLNKINDKILTATVLEKFPKYAPDTVVGLIYFENKKSFIKPLGRKYKFKFEVTNPKDYSNLKENSLVKAEILGNITKNHSKANIISIINNENISTNLSLLTAYEFSLTPEFSHDILNESTEFAGLPNCLDNYTDLRNLPLVTIDDESAKDFDDAVYVTQISTNPLKYKAIVAIADVSSYVKEGSLLDEEAKNRGNSTYLPGLVIPMLPPILSNEWCSLKPNVDRATLAVELIINHNGVLEDYNFYKALINSKARLTYNEVEQAIKGNLNPKTTPLLKDTILPLYNCWILLNKAKTDRDSLEIKSNEYKVIFDSDGNVNSIEKKEELTAHKIIEDLMITANVAAATFLKNNNLKDHIIYRIHDKPTSTKLENLKIILKSLHIKTPFPVPITTAFFNNLLRKYESSDLNNIINESILSTQSQAKYSNNNIGHFGLSLKEYCHFTSPIRRYSDLVIHRLITTTLNKQKIINLNTDYLNTLSNNLTLREKNSTSAEYSAIEKIIAKLLEDKINCTFNSTIINITNAGLFVALETMGAQGLVPMRTLGDERFIFIKEKSQLIGVTTKKTYRLREKLVVTLKEADVLKGLLTFTPA